MLSGLKFIPRDQVDQAQDDTARRQGHSGSKKGKDKVKKKSRYESSDEEDLERIKKGSRKKWYSSDEESSSSVSYDSDGGDGSEQETRICRGKNKEKKRRSLEEERGGSTKKSRKGTDSHCSFDGENRRSNDDETDGWKRHKQSVGKKENEEDDLDDDKNIVRKEMGLEWMLGPKDDREKKLSASSELQEEPPADGINKVNPRELNPYLTDNGSGFPDDTDVVSAAGSHLLATSVVGDGGASWRLKALKRAQEQAAREGRKLDEVVEERWGSLGQLAASVASGSVAPSRAHLSAIKNRMRQQTEDQQDDQRNSGLEGEKGSSLQHKKMRVPKLHDSLSWGKGKSRGTSSKDVGLISSALSSLNKFADDGSFMDKFKRRQNDDSDPSASSSFVENERKLSSDMLESVTPGKDDVLVRPTLSANQLAAKVMQLRMKGKHSEADKLLKEAEENKGTSNTGSEPSKLQDLGTASRYLMQTKNLREMKKEVDADMHLAQTIVKNKQFKISGQADDEYDYDEGPRRKSRKKVGNESRPTDKTHFAKHILTQQERCTFCFENPNRPRHLVVAIANFTYLMLPQWQPIVSGHCCILTMQHESATRAVDNNVWDEIRNFKKCLIMMFAKQEKDLVFLETVMGLAKQRRHCLVECIPLPQDIAKQAPLYFKKAIDEAEEEWSQHNAKRLIDTSEKGLRASIPKDFPYFHVEFGLKKGFVHVIDDESQFKSNFGLNVVRGLLRLPAEDMHRRRKHESLDVQKQAVGSFARDWEPFDWTKQLD